jgi:hypothetical protein
MADNRTDAQSISSGANKDKLKEVLGEIIQNIQKKAISEGIKNKKYSGDIKAGSIAVARFTNVESKDYGTARAASKGTQFDNKGKVTINLDKHKEIVEEFNKNDIETIGYNAIIDSKKSGQTNTLIRELDRAFFVEAETVGTDVVVTSATELVEKVEMLIQALETTKNEYVDGVNREDMTLTLSPTLYGKLRNYIDKIANANVDSAKEEIEMFHGVKVESNMRQTAEAIIMVNGAIAQPVNIYHYGTDRIPLSNDYALTLFYNFGTKAITPDLIKKVTTF